MNGTDDDLTIVSGHQPSYLPWLGFFHKLSLCDKYVFMDTVQFEDRGWLHRNKIRTPNGWTWLTVPIDKNLSNKDRLDEVYVHQNGDLNDKGFWQNEHWRGIHYNYANAPYYDEYAPELEEIYKGQKWERLIDLCWAQLQLFSRWLEFDDREFVRMTEVDFQGTKDDLVLDHALKLSGDGVVFGTNGRDYVNVEKFADEGIKVYFQDYNHPEYEQRFRGFEPYMSIIDLVFNHGPASRDILLEDNVTRDNLINDSLWENV